MPIKVIKYTCAFKCGTSAKPLSKMVQHEANCIRNPATKSCENCCNRIYDYLDDDSGGYYRSCKIRVLSDMFEDIHEEIGKHQNAVRNCPNFNMTEESPLSNDFAERVMYNFKQNNHLDFVPEVEVEDDKKVWNTESDDFPF